LASLGLFIIGASIIGRGMGAGCRLWLGMVIIPVAAANAGGRHDPRNRLLGVVLVNV